MYFLDAGGDTLLGVLETEGRLPFEAGPDFYSPEFFVFLLKFRD